MVTRYDSVTLTSATAAVRTTRVRALAARTGSRVGTAANVERIMPVEYSPVMDRAPMTAMISIPKGKPLATISAPCICSMPGAVTGSSAMASSDMA